MANIDREIGLRLKMARKTAGFKTALDFATTMNIPKSTYSQHENGKRSLTAEQIFHYANALDVEASWLLTGYGHPCPLGKNKVERKQKIEHEIALLQESCELPYQKYPHIEITNNSAVVNMELLCKIISSALKALSLKEAGIQPDELIAFCVDAYNNIEFLEANQTEKNKMIDFSINSLLRGNNIILKKTINL